MARSRSLPVWEIFPALKFLVTDAALEPRPIWMPDGIWVELVEGAPTVFRFWYMRSWKSGRLFLKPVVFTFARLLAITSMLSCCDCMPDAAVHKALIMIRLLFL